MRAAGIERATLIGMAAGVLLMLQPFWSGGLRAGFFLTLVATLANVIASHRGSRA